MKITNTESFEIKWGQRLCLKYHRKRFYRAMKQGVAFQVTTCVCTAFYRQCRTVVRGCDTVCTVFVLSQSKAYIINKITLFSTYT